jgi:hypothetical protein
MEQHSRVHGAIDVATAALTGGLTTIEGVHTAIARKPFVPLRLAPGVGAVSEVVRAIHDGITSFVYAGLRTAIGLAGGAARRTSARRSKRQPIEHGRHFGPMNHFELLNHPDVYEQMRCWLMRRR